MSASPSARQGSYGQQAVESPVWSAEVGLGGSRSPSPQHGGMPQQQHRPLLTHRAGYGGASRSPRGRLETLSPAYGGGAGPYPAAAHAGSRSPQHGLPQHLLHGQSPARGRPPTDGYCCAGGGSPGLGAGGNPLSQFEGWVARGSGSPAGPGSPHGEASPEQAARDNPYEYAKTQCSNVEECVRMMTHGEWFFKIDWRLHPEKRWFWLDKKRWQLYWAKTDDCGAFFSGVIGLRDIVHIELAPMDYLRSGAADTSHPDATVSLWSISIYTADRRLVIATQMLHKFGKWAGTLLRLTAMYRRNHKAYLLHKDPTGNGMPVFGKQFGSVILS